MSTTPNLASVIESPTIRKIIYTAYVVAVIVVGATQVAFLAIEALQPDWLTGALAVLGYLGIPVGGLALANTPGKDAPAPQHVVNVYSPTAEMTEEHVAAAAARALDADARRYPLA